MLHSWHEVRANVLADDNILDIVIDNESVVVLNVDVNLVEQFIELLRQTGLSVLRMVQVFLLIPVLVKLLHSLPLVGIPTQLLLHPHGLAVFIVGVFQNHDLGIGALHLDIKD